MFDSQQQFYIFAAIEAMSGAGFFRGQQRELRLPIAQNVRFNAEKVADLADLEVQLVRNFRGSGMWGDIRHDPSDILAHSVVIVTVCSPWGNRTVVRPAISNFRSAPSIRIR